MPRVKRDPSCDEEEKKTVFATVVDFLRARRRVYVIPRLPYSGRTGIRPCWTEDGSGDELLETLVVALNALRQEQRNRRMPSCDPIETYRAIRVLDMLAGGADQTQNFDSEAHFAVLAAQYPEVDVTPSTRATRQSGIQIDDTPPPQPPPTPLPAPPPAAQLPELLDCEPTRSRSGDNAFDEAQSREVTATAIASMLNNMAVADPQMAKAVCAHLSPDMLAMLPHAAPTVFATAVPPPAPTPSPERAADASTDTPIAMALSAIAKLQDSDEMLSVLDAIGARCFANQPPREAARQGKSFRRCAIAMQRINEFKDKNGRAQGNFLMSIIECYGADGGERLPLGVMLPWLMYYATRCADDQYWGKTLSGLHFDKDGGFYFEFWRDLLNHGGQVVVNLLRGSMFFGMVKSGEVKAGHFNLSSLSHTQMAHTMNLGTAVPSVKALNQAVKQEQRVTKGGMDTPLESLVETHHKAACKRLSKLTGREFAPLDANALKPKLTRLASARFAADKAHEAMHGGNKAKLVLPTKPTDGWKEEDQGKWWAV